MADDPGLQHQRDSVWVHDATNTGVFVNSLGRYDAFNAGQFFKLS